MPFWLKKYYTVRISIMTNEKWLTICQGFLFTGAIITASATYGIWLFSDLIQKQKDAQQAQKDAEQVYSGILKYDKRKVNNKIRSSKSPVVQIGLGKGSFRLEEGNIFPVDTIFHTKGLDFYIGIEDNQVKVSMPIRDKDGVIVAELIKNEWKINKNNYWDRNYTSDALEVKDKGGSVILQIIVLQDRIKLQVKLYDINGKGIALTSDERQNSYLHLIGPKYSMSVVYIKPIFKYPSETHLGQLL